MITRVHNTLNDKYWHSYYNDRIKNNRDGIFINFELALPSFASPL